MPRRAGALAGRAGVLVVAPALRGWLQNPWTEGYVWPTRVIALTPLVLETPEVVLGERDHEIQAFPPQRALVATALRTGTAREQVAFFLAATRRTFASRSA